MGLDDGTAEIKAALDRKTEIYTAFGVSGEPRESRDGGRAGGRRQRRSKRRVTVHVPTGAGPEAAVLIQPDGTRRHREEVTALAVGRGEDLVSASSDGTVWVWDVRRSAVKHDLDGIARPVYAAARHPVTDTLLVSGQMRDILVFDTRARDPLHRLAQHEHPVVGISPHPGKGR